MNRASNFTHFNRLKILADWLDTKFIGPMGIRFGLDPLLGLIPVVGDVVTLFFSIYILFNSYVLGCSYPVILRMLLNIAIEFFIELIPLLGQVFDFFWKANIKNIQLLEAHIQNPEKVRRRSFWQLFVLALGLCVFFVLCMVLAIYTLKMIIQVIQGWL